MTCINRIQLKCAFCNIIFETIPSKQKITKYCSRKCFSQAKTLKYKGQGNPFYSKRHSIKTKEILSINQTKYIINIGTQINNLTVVEDLGKQEGEEHKWKCMCICGNTVELYGWTIMKQLGCGCSTRLRESKYISNTFMYGLIYNAKKMNREFTLSSKYLEDLLIKQDFKCTLSGISITIIDGRRSKKTTASVDRIDSSKGYIEGNVQWVHKHINIMKSNHTTEYFIELCNKVTNEQTQK